MNCFSIVSQSHILKLPLSFTSFNFFKLQVWKDKRALVVHLVDLTDIQGTFFRRLRDLVSKNPVMLVGTKLDLLPKGYNVKDVADWLLQVRRL